tara:strand:+ start:2790 stop:3653 length:864 start_codon:yes stop_codon:yes gene_type:complete
MITNIFHIGYHKTATTWFQKRFYSLVEGVNFIERENIRAFFYENEEVIFPNSNINIFCDEELSGNIHNGGLSGFLSRDVAKQISQFENPKAIIFIRNQFDMIQSSYLQYIKEGGNYSIDKYLHHKMYIRSNRTALFSFKHLNYYNLIKQYQELIGKENVFVYLFEDFVNNQKNFIESFIETHKLETDTSNLDFSRINYSYSKISYFIARIFNAFSRKNVLFKYYIIHIPKLYEISRELLSRISLFPIKQQVMLDHKIKAEILENYQQSNSKLEIEMGLDLRKYNYPI